MMRGDIHFHDITISVLIKALVHASKFGKIKIQVLIGTPNPVARKRL